MLILAWNSHTAYVSLSYFKLSSIFETAELKWKI